MGSGRTPLVAVVIPYYQATAGLLARCVASVLAQQGAFRLQVLITDDGSPAPARAELAAACPGDPRVTLLTQRNQGPGAARNNALDHLPGDTDYVALLDSDDLWQPGFLACAVRAFECGADLFFADSARFGQRASRFCWDSEPSRNLRGEAHAVLDGAAGIHAFSGDFFDFVVRRSSILSSSVMVYRFAVAPTLRFDERLFNGQDRLFKLKLCRQVRLACFSTVIYGIEGEGVNIFDSAGWGSAKALRRVSSYIRLARTILAEVPLAHGQRRFVKRQLGDARRDFAASLLHLLSRGEPFDKALVRRTFAEDPCSAALLLPNAIGIGLRRIRRGAQRPPAGG
jgi:succinoglycan biosynthesis protein ExoW